MLLSHILFAIPIDVFWFYFNLVLGIFYFCLQIDKTCISCQFIYDENFQQWIETSGTCVYSRHTFSNQQEKAVSGTFTRFPLRVSISKPDESLRNAGKYNSFRNCLFLVRLRLYWCYFVIFYKYFCRSKYN